METVAINGRFTSHRVTGMQRYAIELSARFGDKARLIAPEQPLTGARGHLWEQTALARSVRGKLLWSPNNTGPVVHRRQIITIHDLIPIDHPEWFNKSFSLTYKLLMPILARRVLHIVAISDFTKSRIIELLNVSPDKISVIPNGVSPDFHPRTESQIASMRESLGIPSPDYLLCVGSIEPRKNISRLLAAWEKIRCSLPESLYLVITGAPGNARVFADRSGGGQTAQERVLYTGYIPDGALPALYSGARAMIYPSLYEGFGLPPLESMACGTPALVANTTCMPELVTDEELRFDPEEVDSIAQTISRAVLTPGWRNLWADAALRRSGDFHWDRATAETWRVIERYL